MKTNTLQLKDLKSIPKLKIWNILCKPDKLEPCFCFFSEKRRPSLVSHGVIQIIRDTLWGIVTKESVTKWLKGREGVRQSVIGHFPNFWAAMIHGGGGSKISQNSVTYFFNGPFLCHELLLGNWKCNYKFERQVLLIWWKVRAASVPLKMCCLFSPKFSR